MSRLARSLLVVTLTVALVGGAVAAVVLLISDGSDDFDSGTTLAAAFIAAAVIWRVLGTFADWLQLRVELRAEVRELERLTRQIQRDADSLSTGS